MKIVIRYRKTAKSITLFSHEKTIELVSDDIANQLTRRYRYYLDKNKTVTTEKALARYRLGEKYLIMAALESMR